MEKLNTKYYLHFDEIKPTKTLKAWVKELVRQRIEQRLQTVTLEPDGYIWGMVLGDGPLAGLRIWYRLRNDVIHPYGYRNPDPDVDYLAPGVGILICRPGSEMETLYLRDFDVVNSAMRFRSI